jgi:multimeric flavodoxin WrbA
MSDDVTRRRFLSTAGIGVAASAALAHPVPAGAEGERPIKIVGLACSLRHGKTTAASVHVALEAARGVAPEGVVTELIDLAELHIPAGPAAGIPLEPGQDDDFPEIAAKLSDAAVAGIIVGTPVYFGNMSSLCKALLERFIVFRRDNFRLANRVAGVLAVGGARHGGQELTLRSVQAALFAQQMIVVGDGPPTAHWGGALWNFAEDDISQDEMGLQTAKNLGRRVVEVALATRQG